MIFCYLCRFRNMGINIGSHAVNEEIIMEITDNIIISEANEFPHSLMQPFCSDFVGIIICQQGMFRFCVDGTSFVASAGETVFLSKSLMFQVLVNFSEPMLYFAFLSCRTDTPHVRKYHCCHAAFILLFIPSRVSSCIRNMKEC